MIEIIGWSLVLIISYKITRRLFRKKIIKNEIILDKKQMQHYGPFTGSINLKEKRLLTKKNNIKKLFIVSLLFTFIAEASEKKINETWCAERGGSIEFRTSYGTFADCLIEDFAVEVEFDYNWKESIGQSLHYAEATNKSAAILLIKRSKSKVNYLEQLNAVINKYDLPIKVFVTNQ
jgi:hypothetical protein